MKNLNEGIRYYTKNDSSLIESNKSFIDNLNNKLRDNFENRKHRAWISAKDLLKGTALESCVNDHQVFIC